MEENKLPDLKLLSLLEKMAKPIETCTFSLEMGGIFAFPEEWKATDELNPGLFSYKVNFEGLTFVEGKIIPREKTEQEKKEEEEALLKKKGGAAAAAAAAAKDKKGQPEVPQLSPEELEAQQRLEDEKLEAERKAKAEWDALSEQEKYYRTREDKYKNDSLKWENNQSSVEKQGDELAALEEEVTAGGAWLYVTKFIIAPEEDIAKWRKTKPPKGVNPVDLNPCNMRAWIDYTEFQTPGVNEIVSRAKLERFLNPEEKPEEFPNPNLEKAYVLVRINLDPPITPLVTEVQPRVEDMVPHPLPIPKMPTTMEVVSEFKGQLVLVMESLALEYSTMFAKEMTSAQETKAKHLSNQQKREIREQRKEKFLTEFNASGKYTILKEKMKKSILKVIRDKYQKSGSLSGINSDSKDQFYSELYTFLTEQMRQSLNDLINEKADKKDDFHEDLILSMKTANTERNNVKATLNKESETDRELRLAQENEIINHLIESEKTFKNLLSLDPENHKNSYLYCQFLIRRRNFPKAEEILNEAIRYNSENRTYIILLACLQARRGRKKEAIATLNSLLDKDPFDSLSNILMAFICTKLSNEPKLGKKYLAVSQRILMRKIGLLPPRASPHSLVIDAAPTFKMPSMQQTPDENVAKKIILTDDQNDEIWIEAADYLVKNGIVDLAAQVIEEIKDKTTPKIEFFNAQIAFINGEVNTAIEILNKLIKQNPKSSEYLLAKANYCFEKDKYYEAEETFLQAFKLRATVKTFATFLRLGYTFLYRKAWTDARAVLSKACELKTNSSLGWLGLGIACLRTGEYDEGEQALTQANIYDPLNAEVWGYLALLCLQDIGRMAQAHQALREMLKCDLQNVELLEELADKLVGHGKNDIAEIIYKKLIDSWHEKTFGTPNTIGNVFFKLAKIYHGQERLSDARLYYNEALKYLEGETDREKVEVILGDIKNILEGGGFNN